MLSFKFVTNASGAAHYFETSDDYYGAEGHKGEWVGEGATALGLEAGAPIDRAVFERLLDGQLPTGERIRLSHTRGSRDRKGIDFTFSAPKSVSIQALVSGDQRIIAAHDAAVRRSLELMQTFAAARKKEAGRSFRERTGNLAAATFRHELSRAQDPQLHTHAVVLNLTRRSDGQWRALANEEMLRNVRMVGAFYRATLANELQALGFPLRETRKGGWELAHVPDVLIRRLSQRSQAIERVLSERGQSRDLASTAQKQLITLATRRKKTGSDRAWLHEHWLQAAKETGVDLKALLSASNARREEAFPVRDEERQAVLRARSDAARAAIEFAIAHLAERQGIFSRSELLEVAYGRAAIRSDTHAVERALEAAVADGLLVPELALYQTARSLNIGAADLARDPQAGRFKAHDEAEKLTRASWISLTMAARRQTQAQAEVAVDAAISRGVLIAAEARFATPEARRAEAQIMAIERAGRGAIQPIARPAAVARWMEDSGLNNGQQEAVAMILTTRDRFVGVQGLAGTGKSHMLSRAVAGIRAESLKLSQSAGYRIVGLAPYASQNEALASLGMQSQTLASFLARKAQQASLDSRTIVFLDEAGVVPAHQLEQLMVLVGRKKARLVLCGDRQQTHAVEAGKPFEQLQDAGMTRAMLTEIKRQTNATIRTAVTRAAQGRVPEAVAALRHTVVEVRQDAHRHRRLADAYVRLPVAEQRQTLIVAGTNEARRTINTLVREGLALPAGRAIAVLTGIDMTRAELKSAQSYEAGMLVVPQRSYGEILIKGEQLRVVDHDSRRNTLLVERENGQPICFDPRRHSLLRIYEREIIDLAPGDLVRVSANDKSLGLVNGARYEVVKIDASMLRLQREGQELSIEVRRPLPLQHGYASTIHSAQGLSRERVLVEADTKSLTSNRAVFYVAISRARSDITIFTDDAARLSAAMSREPKKFAALELRDAGGEKQTLDGKLEHAARVRLAAADLRPQKQQGASFGPSVAAFLKP
jgi:conjugative relaxase-like TrwC/TraI family protein